MDGRTHYLNTDLDLTSKDDLTALGEAFKSAGLLQLHVTRAESGLWHAIFEAGDLDEKRDKCQRYVEPELDIVTMLSVIEKLVPSLRAVWNGCTLREFNAGYDCGHEPWSFNQGLSSELLGRIAAAGATFRWTLYALRETAW